MSTTVIVQDETASGKITNRVVLELPAERITVGELIRSRVYQEVKDYNARLAQQPDAPFHGLVPPDEVESRLNPPPTAKTVEWQRQFERATEAFRRGQILLLIDDRQWDRLEDEITLASTSTVSFLRLTPLAGG